MNTEFYELLIDKFTGGIIILNESLEIIVMNTFMEESSGIKREYSFGKDVFTVFPEILNSRLELSIKNSLRNNQSSFLTFTINQKLFNLKVPGTGEEMKQKIQIIPIKLSSSQKRLFIQISDETHIFKKETLLRDKKDSEKKLNQKLSEQLTKIESYKIELENKNKSLIELNEEKNHFLGIVAHDLKNPLHIIEKLSEDLLNFSNEKQFLNRIQTIHDCTIEMSSLISNLLDLNQIESVQLILNKTEFDLVEMLEKIIEYNRYHAFPKKILINLKTESKKIYLNSDKERLSQIINNFLSNAIKFSPINTTIEVRIHQNENCLRLEVIDEGPGLTDEDKANLFGKYKKLSARPTGGESSNGLGLFIVKLIAVALEMKVYCLSEFGKGSTFGLEIPNSFLAQYEEPGAFPKNPECNILFIDDDPVIGNLFLAQAKVLNLNATAVQTSSAAIHELSFKEFDIIIIDFHLENESGENVLLKVKDTFPNKEFYLILSSSEHIPYEELGFHKFYSKIISIEMLKEIVLDCYKLKEKKI